MTGFWRPTSAVTVLVSVMRQPALLVFPPTAAWADGAFTDGDGHVHEGCIEAIVDEGITQGCDTESDMDEFRAMVTNALRNSKGWTLNRAVSYVPVSGDADARMWLASAGG